MAATHFKQSRELIRESEPTGAAQIMDLHLAEVPAAHFASHPAAQARGAWRGMFDIAVWLRTPAGVFQPLQLVLKYQDDNGNQQLLIDRCHSGSHKTVLLNASLPITAAGRIARAGLYLKSVDRGIVIFLEECHLIPQERKARRSR